MHFVEYSLLEVLEFIIWTEHCQFISCFYDVASCKVNYKIKKE